MEEVSGKLTPPPSHLPPAGDARGRNWHRNDLLSCCRGFTGPVPQPLWIRFGERIESKLQTIIRLGQCQGLAVSPSGRLGGASSGRRGTLGGTSWWVAQNSPQNSHPNSRRNSLCPTGTLLRSLRHARRMRSLHSPANLNNSASAEPAHAPSLSPFVHLSFASCSPKSPNFSLKLRIGRSAHAKLA